jgi:hypothetical protein
LKNCGSKKERATLSVTSHSRFPATEVYSLYFRHRADLCLRAAQARNRSYDSANKGNADLSGHPKPANDGHLKTGQRE